MNVLEKNAGILYKVFKDLMDNQIQNFGGASIEIAEIVDFLEAQLFPVVEPVVETIVEKVVEPVIEKPIDEPVVEEVVEPVVETVVEPVVEPTAE